VLYKYCIIIIIIIIIIILLSSCFLGLQLNMLLCLDKCSVDILWLL